MPEGTRASAGDKPPRNPQAPLKSEVAGGFSLHACFVVKAYERNKERICRYIGRSPLTEQRLPLVHDGMVRY